MLKIFFILTVCLPLSLSCEKTEDTKKEDLTTTPPQKTTLANNLISDLRNNLKKLK